jgi:hypothetical protein
LLLSSKHSQVVALEQLRVQVSAPVLVLVLV